MPAKIISTKSAEHYKWGGPQATDCDGWHLVKTPELSVIEELMPPATKETRHSHVHARQFFYVLEGELTLEIEYHEFVLQKGEGIEVSPGQRHQALNKSASPVRIIVTSQPPSHGDRTNEPGLRSQKKTRWDTRFPGSARHCATNCPGVKITPQYRHRSLLESIVSRFTTADAVAPA
jgi:mannose-6-phosphate isomerase-like protein (cupin superfamily)